MEEITLKKINLSDNVCGDIIRIFADPEIIDIGQEKSESFKGFFTVVYKSSDKEITFNDCLAIAQQHGFTTGIFFIMAETPRQGKIFQYANCYKVEPFVSEYGSTIGYA